MKKISLDNMSEISGGISGSCIFGIGAMVLGCLCPITWAGAASISIIMAGEMAAGVVGGGWGILTGCA